MIHFIGEYFCGGSIRGASGLRREREDEKNKERERCKASAEKRFLSLELGLTNKQRDCCSFSAARLSIASSSHSLFFLPDPFLHISPLFNVSVTLLLILQSLVLLTHTKAKLHQCMWIDPGDVSSCVRSSNPSPHGCSTPSMFCSFCQLHNTCLP